MAEAEAAAAAAAAAAMAAGFADGDDKDMFSCELALKRKQILSQNLRLFSRKFQNF